MAIRIGHGVDIHPLVAGRRLVIGGVQIPFELGLDGHSDADVLLHAVMDALLGAAAMGDIGNLFPNSDARYKDANSLELLGTVWKLLKAEKFKISNIDSVVLAEAPKLAPYIPKMKQCIAEVLGVSPDQIGIKASTAEKLGFVGRREGIMASSVALLEQLR